MMETYHVDLFDYWPELTGDRTTGRVMWLARLAAQLPPTSRVARAEHPNNEWDAATYFLRQIDYTLRMLSWGLAGGDKAGPKPEPVYSPGEVVSQDMVEQAEAMASTVASLLNLEGR